MQKPEKNKPAITLMTVLAKGATDESRELLQKYNMGNANNYFELETKLAKLYAKSSDKIEIEKEFVRIHPHKDFILKYNTPDGFEANKNSLSVVDENEGLLRDSGMSSFNGKSNDKKSCACGCQHSSFDGTGANKEIFGAVPNHSHHDTQTTVICVVGIIGLIGLFLHYKK